MLTGVVDLWCIATGRRLIEQVATLLPASAETASQIVRVSGQRNKVQVAGRDLVIKMVKHFRGSIITPDGRHLTVEQREKIRVVIGELAA